MMEPWKAQLPEPRGYWDGLDQGQVYLPDKGVIQAPSLHKTHTSKNCDSKRLRYVYCVRLGRLSGARGRETGWSTAAVCGLSTKKHYAPHEHTRENQGWLCFTQQQLLTQGLFS